MKKGSREDRFPDRHVYLLINLTTTHHSKTKVITFESIVPKEENDTKFDPIRLLFPDIIWKNHSP